MRPQALDADDGEHLLNDEGTSKYTAYGMLKFQKKKSKLLHLSISLNIIFLLGLCGTVSKLRKNAAPFTPNIYSPAQSAVEYETVLFNGGSEIRDDYNPYIGISDSADAAWNELVILRIEKESAKRLPRKTLGIPGDPGYYVITLDVFHQLHCMNIIRKSLFEEKYHYWEGQDPAIEHSHKVHCVEQLRQSLMCSADITAIPWRWVEEAQESFPSSVTEHTCRNFTKVLEWAKQHALPGGFDGFDSKTKILDW